MIIRASNTTKIPSTEGTIWDYPMPNEDIGISYQELNGRGPAKGKYLNKVYHEIYFIISGSAKIFIKGKAYDVGARDIIMVEPNTPHHIETTNLKYITITRPNWYEAQYEVIDTLLS